MGSPGPTWRVPRPLRSVLLASAGAVAWLALSAPAAGADAGSDSHSLLGGITSSVSSLTTTVSHPLESTVSTADGAVGSFTAEVPLPAPESPPATPLPPSNEVLQPAVGSLTGAVDQLIAEVPVVGQVVPENTVTSVVSPVITVAEEAASEVAETVLPPVAEALPVLDAVLPVADLVTDALGESPATDAASGPPGVMAGELDPPVAGDSSPVTTQRANSTLRSTFVPYGKRLAATSGEARTSGGPAPFDGGAEPPGPQLIPAVLGSVSGSGQSSGQSGAAACLLSTYLGLLQPGAAPAIDSSQHAPSPVSFDPGSSPD